MERFLDSDLYYRSLNVPKDARFGYTFLVETRAFLGPDKSVETRRSAFTPDPLNPARYHGPTVLALSEAPPQPYSDFQPNVAAGTLKKQSIRSKILPEERTFSVYTPPGYDGKIPCNLLIVFDGETWGSVPMGTLIPTPTILDNLRAAQKIGPTVALIVDNMSLRNRISWLKS